MKVAIYCRLSAEDRDKYATCDDSMSIQNQKAMLIKFASEQGWLIHDIYSDDDYSGTDRSRPEFNRLIQDANNRQFNVVLCKSQSRFTRELELVEKYINGLFPRLGIRFVSLVDSIDTHTNGNKRSRQIIGLVNEWFLEELSDNIKSVLTCRRKQGYHIGSFAPYGYKKDPTQKGQLLIDQEAAETVREIYKLFLNGHGKQTIARILNERGVPNPTEYKKLHGIVRNNHVNSGPLWSYFTITNILSNEVYIGNMIQRKSGVVSYKTQKKVSYPQDQWIVVRGTHKPIINQETWNLVQELISQKAKPAPKEPEGMFARKVRCFYCGSSLRSVKNGEKRGFKCGRHTLSPDACAGASISLRKLERIIGVELFMLSQELLDEDMLEEGIDPFSDLKEKKDRLEEQIKALQKKINNSQITMRSIYMDKIKGRTTEVEYIDQMSIFGEEKIARTNRIAELAQHLSQIEKTLEINQNKELLIQQYVRSRTITKEIVSILIDYILIGKRDPITKETPVEIHWNL